MILAVQVPQGQHAPPQPQCAALGQAFAQGIQQVIHRAAYFQPHKACKVDLTALHTVTPFQWAEGEQAEDLSAAIKSIIVQLGITTAPGGIQGPLRQLLVSDGQATPCPSVQSQNQAVHGGSFRKNSKTHPQGKHTLWVCLCFNSHCSGKIHPRASTRKRRATLQFQFPLCG